MNLKTIKLHSLKSEKKITLFSEFLGIEKLLTEIEWKGAEREYINFFKFFQDIWFASFLYHIDANTCSNIYKQ